MQLQLEQKQPKRPFVEMQGPASRSVATPCRQRSDVKRRGIESAQCGADAFAGEFHATGTSEAVAVATKRPRHLSFANLRQSQGIDTASSRAPIDLDDNDGHELALRSKEETNASTADATVATAHGSRTWCLLALPEPLELWVESFRHFASTYLACDRTFPHLARSAKRLWRLSGAGMSERELDDERDELSVRRLLQFARDTFSLEWVVDEEPVDEDPCSLRCLHAARESVLSVSYCGSSCARMRQSDVARGEMKMRQRFLEYLNEGGSPDDPLPACDLPQEASNAEISSDAGDQMKQRSQDKEANHRLEAYLHLGGFLPVGENVDSDPYSALGA